MVCASLAVGLVMADPAAAITNRERSMFGYINRARRAHGLRELRLSWRLTTKAHAHSARMARRGYLYEHSCLACMLNRMDLKWSRAGENVGRGSTLRVIHRAFMRSAVHRSNILKAGYRTVGVGVVKRNGTLWVTEIFVG